MNDHRRGNGIGAYRSCIILLLILAIVGIPGVSAASDNTIIGFRWDTSDPSPRLSQIDSTGAMISQKDATFWDNWAVTGNMKTVVITPSNQVIYGTNNRGDGLDLTGASGDVMVEIPRFYTRSTYANGIFSYWISPLPASGFTVAPMFNQRGIGTAAGTPAAYYYVGRYDASLSGNKLQSATGKAPAVDMTIGQARTYAENKGTGWGITNIWTLSGLRQLFYTEMLTLNSQAAWTKSRGVVDISMSDGPKNSGADSIDTQISSSSATGSGTGENGKTPVSYRGIENLWGNVDQYQDGFNAIQGTVKVISPTGLGTTGQKTTFKDVLDATDVQSVGAYATPSGWQKNLLNTDVARPLFLPSAVGGSETTYLSDYYWSSDYDSGRPKILFSGGHWWHGGSAGIGGLAPINDASNSFGYNGARVEFRRSAAPGVPAVSGNSPVTGAPAYVQPVTQSNSGSFDPSGLIILLIIGVVVIVGGYIGYTKMNKPARSESVSPPRPKISKDDTPVRRSRSQSNQPVMAKIEYGKPEGPTPSMNETQIRRDQDIPEIIQQNPEIIAQPQSRTEQTILNQINEIQKNPAVSSTTKSELSTILNSISGINLSEYEPPLKTYAEKQLDSINNNLDRIHEKGVAFTLSPDNIQQMIDTENYVEAIIESDKFLVTLTRVEELYNKSTAYKTAMPDPDIVSLYNEGKYASVIKVYEERQSVIANAKPELTLSLDRTQLSTERWHKLGITLTNTGLAHVENVAFAFSSEFETKGIKPISVKAGQSSRTDISILPKNVGNILLEITLTYKDLKDREYRTVQEFWIDVVEKGTTTSPHSETPSSPVSQFTPRPLTPKQLPPELSDHYTESEFIGKGGFARVFKAKRKDGKLVAVKIPITMDAITGKSFIAEMQNWTKLSHPNIVKLYDFNIMPMPYFEEELCDSALAELKKPIECEETAWILFNVCEGLKFAHEHKIIHRDLKPQNILLKNGTPKISDWGLSRIVSESTSTTATAFTPYYAAPEQINNRVKDERTDIWQIGVILYEFITGEMPFRGDSMIDIAMNIATKDPKSPGEINPEAKVLESVVMKCLQKDPAKRYQSILELQKDLGMYLRTNYAELLKTSVSVQDYTRSSSYCGELIMINLFTGDIPTAYKYLLDLVHYSKGDVKFEAQELSEQIKMRMEMGVTEIPDELIQKAEIIVHQVSVGFRNKR